MISDLDLARLCMAAYSSPPSIPVPKSGVYVCATPTLAGIVVAFRGSITLEDWWGDFEAAAVEPREHPELGLCHAGFLDRAESIVNAVIDGLGNKPAILTGHSLGGAEALGVGALMIVNGKSPLAIVTFGAPRFGMEKFVDVLAPVAIRQYRRGNDPVPCVPFYVPPLLRFLDARDPRIAIGTAQIDAFSCHSIAGYVADMAVLEKVAA